MSSWQGRAQVEPLAALAALLAVGVGLSLYVGALDSTIAALDSDREVTPIATDRLVASASSFGSITPPLDDAVAEARPRGHHLNATLRADGSSWRAGHPVVDSAACERRRVSARVAPGVVRTGSLEVCTWRAP